MVTAANVQSKQIASIQLAQALQSLGFSLTGYHETIRTPEYDLGTWADGTAIHIDYPGYGIECLTSRLPTGKFFAITLNGEVITYGNGYGRMTDLTQQSFNNALNVAKTALAAIKTHQAKQKPAPIGKDNNLRAAVAAETATEADRTEWACPDGIVVTRNSNLNGIEVRFPQIPSLGHRDWMKAKVGGRKRFRFTDRDGDNRWYCQFTEAKLQETLKHFKFEY